ncbi:hypothetical protein K3495_g4239 [Podosphaera aphanis]|nr:hypothetical protein K3495_g4239 [Podosphaera aphanis]
MTLPDHSADCHFQHHVSFDTFAGGETTTEKNTLAFTLNVKHKGYQFKRRSRTFMVGLSEDEHSEIALQWMLDELVDDGDEIICVRVIDRDAKVISDRNVEKRQYQTEAKELLQRIQIRNDDNRAVSIVLEFVAGKLHATFQRMIQIYEPALLIVGTRGRSLGGLQGLMSNRNSFSKWCLQYSPIPVVVVRPTDKRMKKKMKRDADPGRHDYARILRDSGIAEHETDVVAQSTSIWEISNDPEVEAHAVAAALGLPAEFHPPIRPAYGSISTPSIRVDPGEDSDEKDVTPLSLESASASSSSRETLASTTEIPPPDTELESADEESSIEDDDGEDFTEFEAIPGDLLLARSDVMPISEKRIKLHRMEVDEAAALARKENDSDCSLDGAELRLSAPLSER